MGWNSVSVPILTILAAVIPAYFVAKWQATSQFKSLRAGEFYKQKRELYKKVITLLLRIVRDRETTDELLKELRGYNSELLLVGSRRVMQTFGDFLQTVFILDSTNESVNKRFIALLGEVIKAMRRDLGLDNRWDLIKRFQWYDGLRSQFNDIAILYPKVPATRRSYFSMHFYSVKSVKKLPRKKPEQA